MRFRGFHVEWKIRSVLHQGLPQKIWNGIADCCFPIFHFGNVCIKYFDWFHECSSMSDREVNFKNRGFGYLQFHRIARSDVGWCLLSELNMIFSKWHNSYYKEDRRKMFVLGMSFLLAEDWFVFFFEKLIFPENPCGVQYCEGCISIWKGLAKMVLLEF